MILIKICRNIEFLIENTMPFFVFVANSLSYNGFLNQKEFEETTFLPIKPSLANQNKYF